jgi:hypothetical protein
VVDVQAGERPRSSEDLLLALVPAHQTLKAILEQEEFLK